MNVKTNVVKEFLKLIEMSFPPENPLHKLFTRQTLKLSYKCMPSMAHAISKHNAKLMQSDQQLPSQPASLQLPGGGEQVPCPGQMPAERSGL